MILFLLNLFKYFFNIDLFLYNLKYLDNELLVIIIKIIYYKNKKILSILKIINLLKIIKI